MDIHLKKPIGEGAPNWRAIRNLDEIASSRNGDLDLLEAFEDIADARGDSPAIYLLDPRVTGGEARYLSLSFSELRHERDAWSHRLRTMGVSADDRVLVWLPRGLTLVAATYALLRIGAEVALADESMPWGKDMREFEPTVALASEATACRKKLGSSCSILEVRSSLLRVASGVKTKRPRSAVGKRMTSGIVLFREGPGQARCGIRFGPSQVSAMLSAYAEHLCIENGDTISPEDVFMSVLAPALGAACAYTESGFGTDVSNVEKNLTCAIEDLGINRVTRSLSDWLRILDYCEANSIVCEGMAKALIMDDAGQAELQLDRFEAVFPNVNVYSIFGSRAAPAIAVRPLEFVPPPRDKLAVGRPVGRLLAGLRWQISCGNARIEVSEDGFVGAVGELLLRGPLQGDASDSKSGYQETGYYVRIDRDGGLWVCGRMRDVIRTSYGDFYPKLCESVFEGHRKVRRALLLGLTAKASTRLGILIEVEPDCLPKASLEESKFKAELLQLGAECEHTKLILEMFFVERISSVGTAKGEVNREALSRRYSIIAKLKALF